MAAFGLDRRPATNAICGMARAVPLYPRDQVNAAARTMVSEVAGVALDDALGVINNWRSSHSFPLNTFSVRLRKRGRQLDPNCIVAQRIKRLSSIAHKMERFPRISLTQMQDIGGCRAVFAKVEDVTEILKDYTTRSEIRHTLIRQDDYIAEPPPSGYRGVHLIWRYFSNRNTSYNGLKIEMQLRSLPQHAWATAVETVGTFTRQALKSSQGEEHWLRFFALMSSVIALREGTPCQIPGLPEKFDDVIKEVRKLAKQLDVVNRLNVFGQALQFFQQDTGGANYFILVLTPSDKAVTVYGFKRRELALAQEQYLSIERGLSSRPGADAVLVSVDSVAALQRAYPNYFLDTGVFVKLVEEALAGDTSRLD